MFILKIYDRKRQELKEGDIVKVSNGREFTFYAEVKWLEKEKALAPFHTFSFHSFEKVDKVPEGAELSTEERYKIWITDCPEMDSKAEEFSRYLMDWRVCEHLLEKAVFDVTPIK